VYRYGGYYVFDEDQQGQQERLLILLAEDNRINQRVTELIVKRLGYQIDIVANGFEALAALERSAYSVVLMDVEMPKMDGISATRTIRAQYDDTERPYIVALTASEGREDCLLAGMDNYLAKPVRLAELGHVLSEATSTAAAWRAQRGSESPTSTAHVAR
jgi:CheY-like chemotaxis protein